MRHAMLLAVLAVLAFITTSFAPASNEMTDDFFDVLAASPETAALRSKLSAIVDLDDDADFLRAWYEMREDLGLEPVVAIGSVVPVGMGVHVLCPIKRRPTWGFRDIVGERDNVYVGEDARFVRVITEAGVATACGPNLSEEAVVVVGLGDGRAAVVFQETGRVAFIGKQTN